MSAASRVPPARARARRAAMRVAAVAACLACAATPSSGSAERAPPAGLTWMPCGRILTPGSAPIEGGAILLRDGRIEKAAADLERPRFSAVVDARGLTVTPGFVVAATRVSGPRLPQRPPAEGVRLEIDLERQGSDELVARHPDLVLLLEAGITTIGLLPAGEDPGIPGVASAVTTRAPGGRAEVIEPEGALVVSAATHAPWRRAVSEALAKAARRPGGDPGGKRSSLARALARETSVMVLKSGTAQWTAARDVLPFEDLRAFVLDDPDLATLDAAGVKESGVSVLTWPVLVRARATRMPVNRAAAWERAGVPYAFLLPEESAAEAGLLREGAIEMVRTGCSRDAVLGALTREGAAALGVADRVGAIAPGRRADLLGWSGDPFDPTSRLELIVLGGVVVERSPVAGASRP